MSGRLFAFLDFCENFRGFIQALPVVRRYGCRYRTTEAGRLRRAH